jgi:hypothetical protein
MRWRSNRERGVTHECHGLVARGESRVQFGSAAAVSRPVRSFDSGDMPLLAAPILAQVLTLTAGNRDEVRWVAERTYSQLQVEARLLAGAGVTLKHGSVGVAYSPSLIVAPGQRGANTGATVLNTVYGDVRWFGGTRRSSFQFSESAEVSQRNFFLQSYSSPAPSNPTNTGTATPGTTAPGGTPPDTMTQPGTTPTPGSTPTGSTAPKGATSTNTKGTVFYGTSRTDLTWTRELTHSTSFTTGADYLVSGGLDRESQLSYPLLQGPEVRLSLTNTLSARDSVSSSIDGRYTLSSRGERAWSAGGTEQYIHWFARRTHGTATAGVMFTRIEPPDPVPVDYLGLHEPRNKTYPLGIAELVHTAPYEGGTVFVRGAAAYLPVLDPIRVVIDPRFIGTLGSGWSRRRFTLSLSLDTTISLQKSQTPGSGSLNSWSASTTVAYELDHGFGLDGGARITRQLFEDVTTVPATGLVFVAVSWNGSIKKR